MLVYSFWRYRDYAVVPEWNLGNYLAFFHSSAYSTVLLRTALLSLLITLISVCLAYPFAYFLVCVPRRLAVVLVVMVMIPLWANTIVRNFVWFSILGERGLINRALTGLGIVARPVPILFTPTAVLIVGVYISISFAALALFPVLEKISPSLVESAKDLGATPLGAFRRVTLPLSLAGVQAAALLVFVPTLGLFITPMLLGGPNATMMANLVVPFFNAILNYAQGAALSFVALVLVVIAMIALGRSLDLEKLYASGVGSAMATRSAAPTPWGLRLYAGGFLLFLFLPVIMLVVFSLNESMDFPLREWTVDWYYQVLTNPIVADAATNTLIIGFSAALIAIAICAPLAYGIVRFQYRFGGLLNFLVLLPMVVPGFMLGAALLVVLNKVGLAFSLTAIIIGHVTVARLHVRAALRLPGAPGAAADLRPQPRRGRARPGRQRPGDLPQGHAAPDAAGHPRGRALRVHPVARRVHHHLPAERFNADHPHVHLRPDEKGASRRPSTRWARCSWPRPSPSCCSGARACCCAPWANPGQPGRGSLDDATTSL